LPLSTVSDTGNCDEAVALILTGCPTINDAMGGVMLMVCGAGAAGGVVVGGVGAGGVVVGGGVVGGGAVVGGVGGIVVGGGVVVGGGGVAAATLIEIVPLP